MANTLPQFLKRSPKTGTYSYERWVPEDVRHLFLSKDGKPKTIHRVPFKTKDLIVAERMRLQENRRFDAICRTGSMPDAQPLQLPHEHIDQIVEELRLRGLLPEQQIKIDALSDQDTMLKIEHDIKNPPALAALADPNTHEITEEAYLSAIHSNDWMRLKEYQTDREVLRFDLIDRFGNDETKWPDRDKDVLTYRVLSGEIDISPEPNINDALTFYIREKRLERRNPEQQSKLEADVKSVTSRIFSQLPQGMGTKLSALKKHTTRLRELCEKEWPNAPTRLKNTGYLRAMINAWNSQDTLEVEAENPFTKVAKTAENLKDTQAKTRRSGTSAEFDTLWNNLLRSEDMELKLIGLLYLYCGLPAREAKGMLRDDVKIKSDPPHMLIRDNDMRKMGKGRIGRYIPLVEPILTVVHEYLDQWTGSRKDDLLFPKRYKQSSADTAKAWKPYLVNLATNDNNMFSMYSFRHSFKERLSEARVEPKYQSYLFGHSTEETKKLSKATIDRHYSDKTASKKIMNDLTAIMQDVMAVKDFGYVEESDLD